MRSRNINFHVTVRGEFTMPKRSEDNLKVGGGGSEKKTRKTHDKFHNCITSATSEETTFFSHRRISYSHILHFLLSIKSVSLSERNVCFRFSPTVLKGGVRRGCLLVSHSTPLRARPTENYFSINRCDTIV